VSLQNWCNISSSPSHLSQAPQSKNGLCRVCVSRLTRPILLIPCGHSFCESVRGCNVVSRSIKSAELSTMP
jgi:hypothetical protein